MYFSDNPSDRYYERMMVGIPNFKPRGHGVVIVGSRPTEPLVILRIQDGTATHREILTETTKAINHRRFRHRLNKYLKESEMNPTDLPLTERKALLQKAVIEESARFAVSRVVENNGVAFFWLAKARELEGIIAKRKDSRYYFDKRTKDWIKCKNLKDADYVVCGYLPKENGRISLVLGQYAGGTLTYKGHVTLGVCGGSFRRIRELPRLDTSPFAAPAGNERAVWVAPVLCCTVKYMEKTESGHLRQPVFKGLREDKLPEECVEHESRVTEKRRG